jgi:hypothetical protein
VLLLQRVDRLGGPGYNAPAVVSFRAHVRSMGVVGRIGERNTTYGVHNTRLELMKSELLYRVAGAVAMRDGIAVANGGARQVWLYDGEARLSWRAGRAGDGPGEFQDLAAIFGIAGDSLLAMTPGCVDSRWWLPAAR